MPLVPLTELLADARRQGYAVGYFEAWGTYSLEAVAEAAEAERAPVVLGFGCKMVDPAWLDEGGIELLGALGRARAERTPVPVALLLNEAQTYEQAERALEAGFNAVMLATDGLAAEDATASVERLVAAAHARGVAVEAEVGRLPEWIDGRVDDTAAAPTDPDEAAEFVASTGIDCLAVSVGNVHCLVGARAEIDLERLEAVHTRAAVPLAIHGGSGFPLHAVAPALARGVAKFNVGTALKQAFLDGLRAAAGRVSTDADVHALLGSRRDTDLLAAAQARMRMRVRELIAVYGAAGRA